MAGAGPGGLQGERSFWGFFGVFARLTHATIASYAFPFGVGALRHRSNNHHLLSVFFSLFSG